MTPSLEKAKMTLLEGGFTFVLVNGDQEYVSSLMGIAPLLSLLKNSPGLLKGASVADKVVGKAAAMLMLYGGVSDIYSGIISHPALSVLEKAELKIESDRRVSYIENRAGTDMCPMEKRVLHLSDPEECYRLLSDTLEQLDKT